MAALSGISFSGAMETDRVGEVTARADVEREIEIDEVGSALGEVDFRGAGMRDGALGEDCIRNS